MVFASICINGVFEHACTLGNAHCSCLTLIVLCFQRIERIAGEEGRPQSSRLSAHSDEHISVKTTSTASMKARFFFKFGAFCVFDSLLGWLTYLRCIISVYTSDV
jgi:hypothetical protein